MCNIYFTVEPEWRIKAIFANLKSFFILNISDLIDSTKLDLDCPANIYYLNNLILEKIDQYSKIKRIKGIIYINNKLCHETYMNIYKKFSKNRNISKFILIDDGEFPKLTDLHKDFSEVLFFEKFKKIKILECTGFSNENQNFSLETLSSEDIKE